MLTPPPLFATFLREEPFVETLRACTSSEEAEEAQRLAHAGLPPITSIESLALLFGYSPRLLGAMAKRPGRYYRAFKIRSGRRERTIHTPRIALKLIQRWFAYYVSRSIAYYPHVHGFVPGRSTATAALSHCPADWVISVDIRDFFGSVTKQMVFDALLPMGYSRKGAHLIADLTTLGLNPSLPQGAPTSPVLSNLVFRKTDERLAVFAEAEGVRVSRYADDISISAVGRSSDSITERLVELISREGWNIADEKTRLLAGRPMHPRVLGLLVHRESPRLPKRYRNKLRMMRHVTNGPQQSPDKRNQFLGHLAYSAGIDRISP